MTSRFFKAGVVASGAMLFAMFTGTGFTGAVAQDQAIVPALEASAVAEAPAVRFVATEVVQDVPEATQDVQVTRTNPTDAGSLRELVTTLAQADTMSGEMLCLAQAVYFESRGEPLAGQLAVARVVINRSDANTFPDDYCSVVKQRAQFSFVRNGNIPMPNTSTNAWQRASAIARIAHQELWESEAADALYFHATHVSPRWARNKTSRARIDSHIFYR